MPTSDPIEILIAHDAWANQQLLKACDGLTEAQLHQRFDIGPGSLHDTLTHIAGAIDRWCDVLEARPRGPRLEDGGPYTLSRLRTLLAELGARLERAAAAAPLSDLATAERDGASYTFPRAGIIAHITTHGMHHRAQCLNMLRHLGVDPLPPSSVTHWMLEA